MRRMTSNGYAPVPQHGSSTYTPGDASRRQAQLAAQNPVDGFHHVLYDLRRRVPHTQFFAQLRVISFQERLVEILHRLGVLEAGEENSLIHPVQGLSGPIQHLVKPQGLELHGIRKLVEECLQDWNVQVVGGEPPVEGRLFGWLAPVPQNPGGEYAIK